MSRSNRWLKLFPKTKKVGIATHHYVKYSCCGIEKWLSASAITKFNGSPICSPCSKRKRWSEHYKKVKKFIQERKDLYGNPITHCKTCGVKFDTNNVHSNTYIIAKDNFHRCKHCTKEHRLKWSNIEKNAENSKRRRETYWYKWLIRSAKRKRVGKKIVPVSIDEKWVLSQFQKQDGKCYWTGVELEITNFANHPLKPSLDRLEIKGDYSSTNTVLTALSVNIGRNDNNAIDFKKFIKKIASN
tara:strand:+ start:797 stop:1525 length:729 start_codon:yes stop_codon:yes gene_type:complete